MEFLRWHRYLSAKAILDDECECNKFVTDSLGKIKFSIDFENTGQNEQFKLYYCESLKSK